HTHMDHFFGFDRLLRLCLGRNTSLRLYGPPGFAAQVEHKLAGYTWNLVDNYPGDFFMDAWELDAQWQARGTRLRCRNRFRAEPLEARHLPGGVLLDEPALRVRAAFLDHGTPCLGFAVEEKIHVNVWKNRLAELGLAVGPWLKFLDQDADHAARKHHLTARQAGSIARAAGAKLVTPFHFSPRYADREADLRREIEAAAAAT
ncbi:MAG: hypothetical protein GZ093_19585, partial [Rhodoferax sp.]|nr:hypothetical protein [Rhodoferax sp.]